MPKFICPISNCINHDGINCKLDIINVNPVSDNYEVTISCVHQEMKKEDWEINHE